MGCLLLPAGRQHVFYADVQELCATGKLFPVIPLNQISVFEFLHLTVAFFFLILDNLCPNIDKGSNNTTD
jgi:hypothetical protein